MRDFQVGDQVQIVDGPHRKYIGTVRKVAVFGVLVETPPIVCPYRGDGYWLCAAADLSLIAADEPDDLGLPPDLVAEMEHDFNEAFESAVLNGPADVAAEALASAVENFTEPVADTTNPKDALGVKKAALRFVPPALAIIASDAMADGAAKYGAFNWRETDVRLMVYIEAIERHIAALKDGQDCAEDSGHSHLSHIAANVGIIADADVLGMLIDDRPSFGAAPQLLRERDKTAAPELTYPMPADPDCDCPWCTRVRLREVLASDEPGLD